MAREVSDTPPGKDRRPRLAGSWNACAGGQESMSASVVWPEAQGFAVAIGHGGQSESTLPPCGPWSRRSVALRRAAGQQGRGTRKKAVGTSYTSTLDLRSKLARRRRSPTGLDRCFPSAKLDRPPCHSSPSTSATTHALSATNDSVAERELLSLNVCLIVHSVMTAPGAESNSLMDSCTTSVRDTHSQVHSQGCQLAC